MDTIEKIKAIIKETDNIVFFGGAGVSTGSGIPDFRSSTGLYNQKHDTEYSPEYMLSHEFFESHPGEFSLYVKQNLIHQEARPNPAHKFIVELEKQGKLKGVVTQNIDSLHQMAGSEVVHEIHGNLRDYYCVDCGTEYGVEDYLEKEDPPRCDKCSGIIRADVVLYGETLKQDVVRKAVDLIKNADVLIVGGTSLIVYPASGFLNYYKGNKMVLINKDRTPRDSMADYIVYGDIGETLEKVLEWEKE